ncbi:MAG: GlsB/YeaQ/YmgE family stress response membrane protein [Psychrobacter sp.]|nr:GlsB/YeaQ/YmgE family stress response membrane protein [Psychrobacter sp.]
MVETIIAGLIFGMIACIFKLGKGSIVWVVTLGVGVIGAVLGNFTANYLGLASGLMFTVIGALVLLFLHDFLLVE